MELKTFAQEQWEKIPQQSLLAVGIFLDMFN